MTNFELLGLTELNAANSWNRVISTINENFRKVGNFVMYLKDSTGIEIEPMEVTAGKTLFMVSTPYEIGTNSLFVYKNDVPLEIRTDFLESSTVTFQLTTPCVAGDTVIAVIKGKDASSESIIMLQAYTAEAGQQGFILNNSYSVGMNTLDIYVNNVRQWVGTGFTETSPSSFEVSNPLEAGDKVIAIVKYMLGTVEVERFSATEGQRDFTFVTAQPFTPGSNMLEVYRGGVRQWNGSGFSELSATSFRLSDVCTAGEDIVAVVKHLKTDIKIERFVATENQTVVNLTNEFSPGGNRLEVYVNNVRQWEGTSYAEASATSIQFLNPLETGDEVSIAILS